MCLVFLVVHSFKWTDAHCWGPLQQIIRLSLIPFSASSTHTNHHHVFLLYISTEGSQLLFSIYIFPSLFLYFTLTDPPPNPSRADHALGYIGSCLGSCLGVCFQHTHLTLLLVSVALQWPWVSVAPMGVIFLPWPSNLISRSCLWLEWLVWLWYHIRESS